MEEKFCRWMKNNFTRKWKMIKWLINIRLMLRHVSHPSSLSKAENRRKLISNVVCTGKLLTRLYIHQWLGKYMSGVKFNFLFLIFSICSLLGFSEWLWIRMDSSLVGIFYDSKPIFYCFYTAFNIFESKRVQYAINCLCLCAHCVHFVIHTGIWVMVNVIGEWTDEKRLQKQ